MRKFSSLSILSVVSVVGLAALCAGACSSSSPKSDGGSTGTGGTGGSGGDPLIPSATGFVDDVTTGVIGAWYSYGDGAGSNANATNNADMANSDCIKAGFTADQCSQIVSPIPGTPGTLSTESPVSARKSTTWSGRTRSIIKTISRSKRIFRSRTT